MQAVEDLVSLEQVSNEPSSVYMSKIRVTDQVVGKMQVSELLPLFTITNIDQSRYPGLLNK